MNKECCKWMDRSIRLEEIVKLWNVTQNQDLYHINGNLGKLMKYCPFCGQELFFGKDPLEE